MKLTCAHEPCRQLALVCWKEKGKVAATYCTTHAPKHSYCKSCGKYDPNILGGKASAQWISGLCRECSPSR